MICPLEKPPLTVRISVTDRCQLRCKYCMPTDGVPLWSHEDILSFEQIAEFVERLQLSFDIGKVRLTGGDPLARKGIVSLVAMLADLGVPDLAMTTNAQLLGGMAADLRAAGIHRVNISLDSLDPETFERITRGGAVARTVAGIEAALDAQMPVKLNMVVMRGINDHEVCDVLSFALDRSCELRFLELMPVGYGSELFDSAYVSTASVQQTLSSEFDLEPVPHVPGSSARRCRVRRAVGADGVVGFISACSDPFCEGCSRLRLTADGRLIGCLARDAGHDIRQLLNEGDGDALAEVVRQAMQSKRDDKHFVQPRAMASIGG